MLQSMFVFIYLMYPNEPAGVQTHVRLLGDPLL